MINQQPPIRGVIVDPKNNTTAPWLQWFRSVAADIKELSERIVSGQPNIQFQDEGVDVGTSGGVTTVDFVGNAVTATEVDGTLTVTINNQVTPDGTFVKTDQSSVQAIVNGSPTFAYPLTDTSGLDSVALNTRILYDSSEIKSEDWNNRKQYQADGTTVAWDWVNGVYKDPDGKTGIRAYDRGLMGYDQLVAVDWDVKRLYDSNIAKLSVDWENRKLYKSNGTTVSFDWETYTPVATVDYTNNFLLMGG